MRASQAETVYCFGGEHVSDELRRSQRASVLRKERRFELGVIISQSGFDPGDFIFDEKPPRLTHRRTGEFFKFVIEDFSDDGDWRLETSYPGVGTTSATIVNSFSETKAHLMKWCADLKAYVQRIDRSATLTDFFAQASERDSPMQSLTVVSSIDNDVFSKPEQSRIFEQLGQLRNYITEQSDLTQEKLDRLGSQIRYLTEASERLGRKDWLNILFSVLVGFMVSGIFDPSRAEELVKYGMGLFQFLLDSRLFR